MEDTDIKIEASTGAKVDFDSLDLVPVGSLIKMGQENWLKFFVPAYQRGYRWSAEQAEQFIDDLDEFVFRTGNNHDAFYCIQPLVVKPKVIDNSHYLEVIDGQQRLTTILLLLQAIHQLYHQTLLDSLGDYSFPKFVKAPPKEAYEIKYETREDSRVWLSELAETLSNETKRNEFDNKNCDYSHFVEVFNAVYTKLEAKNKDDLEIFIRTLKKDTYFIWYLPNDDDENIDIFDRLNAGKIGLNNAELIKALFLQHSNISSNSLTDLAILQKIAHEWDEMEKRLHNDSFWGFIYSQQSHTLTYDSRIEYLLDLLVNKTGKDKESIFYTFNKYLRDYRKMLQKGENKDMSRLGWVVQKWDEIKTLFDLICEWYGERDMYHRIGFIIELNPDYTLTRLQDELPGLSHSARIKKLDDIIKETVKGIKSENLFHGKKELSVILFLYNILLEDRRRNSTARFSFADYKQVRKDKGWDQEHVASSKDHEPSAAEQKEMATDIIELITGLKPVEVNIQNPIDSGDATGKQTSTTKQFKLADNACKLKDEEQQLCEMLLDILNRKDDEALAPNEFDEVYSRIVTHFKGNTDPLGVFKYNKEKREKDFIWNFVLLNAKTNRSYGNHIFPVKRRRILNDEFDVYTPVGTRYVFEKAYSRKIDHIFAWTKSDALAYWNDIKRVVKDYVTLTDLK